jgi:hypothetical protein
MSNSTGPRPNSDTNYGVVGDKTLRTAAQLGNENGPIDYNQGVSTSQTIRTVLSSDSTVLITQQWRGVIVFDELAAIPVGTETSLVTYVASADYRLKRVEVTGSADAIFACKINGTTISKKRNNWCDRNIVFDFKNLGLEIASGDVITLAVVSYGDSASPFEGTIYGEEKL